MNNFPNIANRSELVLTCPLHRSLYPFDLCRFFCPPVSNCFIGSRSVYEDLYKLMHWARGLDSSPSWKISDVGDNTVTYGCEYDDDCNSIVVVKYKDNSRTSCGIVMASNICECRNIWPSAGKSTWRNLIAIKYEDEARAVGAVYWYFNYRGFLPPLYVSMDSGVSSGHGACIVFNAVNEEEEQQRFTFRFEFREDGGVRIIDPCSYDSRLAMKVCVVCKRYGTDCSLLMFGIGCKRQHGVCEECVKYKMCLRSTKFRKSNEEESGVLMNHYAFSCPVCKEEIDSCVDCGFPGIKKLLVMRPICWLGEFPIYTEDFYDAIVPFFKEHIDWYCISFGKARRYFQDIKFQRYIYKKWVNEAALLGDDICVSLLVKTLKLCVVHYKAMKYIINLMGTVRNVVLFLFEPGVELPDELLNKNESFFEGALAKTQIECAWVLYDQLPALEGVPHESELMIE